MNVRVVQSNRSASRLIIFSFDATQHWSTQKEFSNIWEKLSILLYITRTNINTHTLSPTNGASKAQMLWWYEKPSDVKWKRTVICTMLHSNPQLQQCRSISKIGDTHVQWQACHSNWSHCVHGLYNVCTVWIKLQILYVTQWDRKNKVGHGTCASQSNIFASQWNASIFSAVCMQNHNLPYAISDSMLKNSNTDWCKPFCTLFGSVKFNSISMHHNFRS